MPESNNDHIDENHDERPSKTQRKKEMIALQKLGETLIALPKSQLSKIPLPEPLQEAINLARSLKSHEAKRRQAQYVGKLMREIDPAPIQAALEKLQTKHEENTSQFHQIEQWRDQLIDEGDEALQKFIVLYPDTDRQLLRQLIRKAQHDRKMDKKTGGEIELFRYLRDLIK